jgi:uncharacterized protein (DUF427 family)
MKATWNDKVIAESNKTISLEGNEYFPPNSIKREFIKPSDHHTVCPWKGKAHYYDVVVDGKTNKNAAWYYPEPSEKASHIKDYVAFWHGVQITQ